MYYCQLGSRGGTNFLGGLFGGRFALFLGSQPTAFEQQSDGIEGGTYCFWSWGHCSWILRDD
jgi:hypothetical protein